MFNLVLILLRSTEKYVLSKIANPTNAEWYEKGINDVFNIYCDVNTMPGRSLSDLERELNRKLWSGLGTYPKGIFSNPKKYYEMAFRHSIDIVGSLNRRFVTGGHSSYFSCNSLKKAV